MDLQNCRCFQEHLRMLLHSLCALCFAPGRPGSMWIYWGEPVRSTGVSGRFACGFRTDLHFADVPASFPARAYKVGPAWYSLRARVVIPASFAVGAGGIVLTSCCVGLWAPSSDPSSARSHKSPPMSFHPLPCRFPSLGKLAVGVSCTYRGMEVEQRSHGWQPIQMVRWYRVDWCDCCHACLGHY